MTTVYKRGRLRISIYQEVGQKHHSAHCHVYLTNTEAVFDLNNLECFANNGFSKKTLEQINGIIAEHQEEFLDFWRLLNEEENN